MSPLILASWRRNNGSNGTITGGNPAGQAISNVPSTQLVSSPLGPTPSTTSGFGLSSSSDTAVSSSLSNVLSSATPSLGKSSSSSPPPVQSSSHPVVPSSSVNPPPSSNPVQSTKTTVQSSLSSVSKTLSSTSVPGASSSPPIPVIKPSSTQVPSQQPPASTPASTQVSSDFPLSSTGTSNPHGIVSSSSGVRLPASIVPTTFVSGSMTVTSSVTNSTGLVVAPAAIQAETSSTGSNHNAAIIGGSVGGAVLVILLLALFCCMRRRSRKKHDEEADKLIDDPRGLHPCCNPGLRQVHHEKDHGRGPEEPLKGQPPTRMDSFKSGTREKSSPAAAGLPTNSDGSAPPPRRGVRRKLSKRQRPPPLKPESLIVPVFTGPANGLRQDQAVNRVLPTLPTPDLGEIPFNGVDHQDLYVEAPRNRISRSNY